MFLPQKSGMTRELPASAMGYLGILGMFRLRAGDLREAKYLSGAALNMTSLRRHGEENVFSSG
jgi:hypothetical protein